MKSIQAKIVLLGSQGVGKTSLVTKYVTKMNSTDISPTIGATFFNCRITLDDIRVNMQVWDTAGQERFRSMAPMYYRGANAALLVFELTNYNSFVDIKTWISELQRTVVDQIVLTLVGNKCDLPERAVSKEEATLYANSIGGYYFETSSLTNQGYHCIEKAFTQTALGLIHLSGEVALKRYESLDQLPTITADQSLLMTSAISLGLETGQDTPNNTTSDTFETGRSQDSEEGRVENVAFSIDHIAHGDEHRTGCCW